MYPFGERFQKASISLTENAVSVLMEGRKKLNKKPKTKQKTVLISLYYHLLQRCAACHFHRLSQFLHSLQCTNIWVSRSINYIYYVSSMLTFPNKHEADGNTMISIGNQSSLVAFKKSSEFEKLQTKTEEEYYPLMVIVHVQ